ncbi:MAG: hypothetical protein ACPGXK_13375 [Phycisphaerae bacterium]
MQSFLNNGISGGRLGSLEPTSSDEQSLLRFVQYRDLGHCRELLSDLGDVPPDQQGVVVLLPNYSIRLPHVVELLKGLDVASWVTVTSVQQMNVTEWILATRVELVEAVRSDLPPISEEPELRRAFKKAYRLARSGCRMTILVPSTMSVSKSEQLFRDAVPSRHRLARTGS